MTDAIANHATSVRSAPRLWAPRVVLAAACLAAGVGTAFEIGSQLLLTLLVQATINGIFALSVGTLLRMNGVVSFGHAAFFGLAVYIVGSAMLHPVIPAELTLFVAIAFPTGIAFLLGLGIVGIPGVAFGMLTLAVGQAAFEFAMKARSVTGGDDGFDFQLPPTLFGVDSVWLQKPHSMFVICWCFLVIVVFALAILDCTRFGRLALAIRENEERARFIGYKTRVVRSAVFALSAFIAALAGVLSSLYTSYASPDVFHWSVSGSVLIMVIIGGAQLVWGPAFGAILFFFFKDVVGNYTTHWQGLVGATLIAVTLLIPQGIGGFASRHLSAFVTKRKG
jgi:branched-chain amino acid transport system permease protein